jgi:hypothetical protein
MQAIGFLKKYDQQNRFASEMDDYQNSTIELGEGELEKVIDYLNRGKIFFDWMHKVFDDQIEIGPCLYYTDGSYIWPVYYPYFINKHGKAFISAAFIAHLREREFKYWLVTKDHLTAAEQYLMEISRP